MTADENVAAIALAKSGQRVHAPRSLVASEDTRISASCPHRWRVIACDSQTDVVECSSCGKQGTCPCDFDDEFA